MLVNLHVKNLALIEEADVDFQKGLNVITGETGAGKSLLLGSVNIALGGKMSKDMLRHDADSALVELTFYIEDEATLKALSEIGYPACENEVIISRKLSGGRVSSRVNGESCTAASLKEIAELLMNIHGQKENMTLLKNEKQLEMLDAYGKDELAVLLEKTENAYRVYKEKEKAFEQYALDEEARTREISRLEYEINEIEEASLREGEEEELESRYRLMNNSKNIVEALSRVHESTGYDSGAGDMIGRALREISVVSKFDDSLKEIEDLLNDIEALLVDANRQAAVYLEEFSFSDQEFSKVEERLDLIRKLESKYGATETKVNEYAKKAKERLEFLNDYEAEKIKAEKELEEARCELEKASDTLSASRKACAKKLCEEIKLQLAELNFAKTEFLIEFAKAANFRKDGYDNIEIMISANPGEPVKELSRAASGGELSRIMLAIRTILADADSIGTVIFDEIDTGISGRTAQMVSEKMARIAKNHQVLCVTHLAQIAAMADHHFLIEKSVSDEATKTDIKALSKEDEINELARILGGSKVTEAVFENAREMKALADEVKESYK